MIDNLKSLGLRIPTLRGPGFREKKAPCICCPRFLSHTKTFFRRRLFYHLLGDDTPLPLRSWKTHRTIDAQFLPDRYGRKFYRCRSKKTSPTDVTFVFKLSFRIVPNAHSISFTPYRRVLTTFLISGAEQCLVPQQSSRHCL